MEEKYTNYNRTVKLKDGSVVKTYRIIKTLETYVGKGKTEKLEIALSTREKSSRLLPFLRKKEAGFCVFREGKPEKYVRYHKAINRLNGLERKYAKLSGGPHDRDEEFTYKMYDIKSVLESIRKGESVEKLMKGGESVEEIIKSGIFIREGLNIF